MEREGLPVRDVVGSFAPGQSLRAVLLLTYSSDGRWFEQVLAPELFERRVDTALIIRDANALISEIPGVRCHRADAIASRVFHPKLLLLVSENRALAVIGSANLTRGGYERNLELGLRHELSPEGGPKSLFNALYEYISGPLEREVVGASLSSLREVGLALKEVLKEAPDEQKRFHVLLHSYDQPIWERLQQDRQLVPHKVLSRAIIVSPFFEPDLKAGGDDPPSEELDGSLFARLFEDFRFEPPHGEKPVSIYFQHASGDTLLPLTKLSAWKDQIALHARRDDSQDPRRLHGKLLVLEGARGPGREPFLTVLHGSPNFTAAAFLRTAPDSNSELAVLTRVPWQKSITTQVIAALGLPARFHFVEDWDTFRPLPIVRQPPPFREHIFAVDATLRVAEGRLALAFQGALAGTAKIRIWMERAGAWTQVAEADWTGANPALLAVPGVALPDDSKVLTLASSRVRVELLDADGDLLFIRELPLNVDCPQQFCGLAMVGPVLLSLDQRIALSGSGAPMTYREQQNWLEQLRASRRESTRTPSVLTHQADLDRFYRNLHTGFRGLRARQQALPRSAFTLRRNLRDLTRWLQEALTHGSEVPGDECRLFLVDRLGRELEATLSRAAEIPELQPELTTIASELDTAPTVDTAIQWLHTLPRERLGSYVQQAHRQLDIVRAAVGGRGAR